MSGSPSPKKADSVVARLTDPKNYTGSHAHRFDADGKGRGLAGRAEVVEFKGNTNTASVDHTVDHSKQKKPVVTAPLGQQKFGTQAAKSANITLYRNGDKHHKGETFTVKGVKNLEQLLDKASNLVKLPTGAVRKMYFYKTGTSTRATVKTLEELVDGGIYLCCGGEKPAEDEKLPQGWLSTASA